MAIKTAVIGYGLSAKIFHIPFLLSLPDRFTLHGIVQRNPTTSNNAAADHAGVKTYTTNGVMFADPEVQLVIVTSIPGTHFDLCKAAIEAGKHVLCEKPFVPSSAEARTLSALAKEKSKVLAVYQNRRWDADFITLQALVADGSLGRIAEAESHFDRHRPQAPTAEGASWKTQDAPPAGGAIYDLGTHLLDQMFVLFGMPARITAFVGNQRHYPEGSVGGNAGGDSFTVHLHFPERGLLATAKAGVVSAEMQQLRYWVRGEKGSFKKFHLDCQEDQLKAGKRPATFKGPGATSQFGVEASDFNGTVTTIDPNTDAPYSRIVGPQSPPKTYVEFYRLLADAIDGKGQSPVTADEAANVLRLVELAIESSKTGRTLDV